MNNVYLIGRVTRDLELQHYGTNERSYVQFALAVNEYNSSTKEISYLYTAKLERETI